MKMRYVLRLLLTAALFLSVVLVVQSTEAESVQNADETSSGKAASAGDHNAEAVETSETVNETPTVIQHSKPTKAPLSDDPNEAWDEWGETEQSRKNPMPRRQREIEVGMDINSIIGMAMRQKKVFFAYLKQAASPAAEVGQQIISRYYNLMAAGGVACRLWYVHQQQRQVVLNCETLRDGHMGKDFLLTQPEIEKVVLDNLAFTPKPSEDDDDDADNADGGQSSTGDKSAASAGVGSTPTPTGDTTPPDTAAQDVNAGVAHQETSTKEDL